MGLKKRSIRRICDGLGFLGIELEEKGNLASAALVSSDTSRIRKRNLKPATKVMNTPIAPTPVRVDTVSCKNMKTPAEYVIIAVPFHADAATHEELARKVNEKLSSGFELHGPPFLGEEMMYQAMTRPMPPH